jgi:hypothetical protein
MNAHSFFRSHRDFSQHAVITGKDAWREFRERCTYRQWVYLIEFSNGVYAWGSASNDGARLAKTGLLQRKLTGKYDRRGDYLMLRAIYGTPQIDAFEYKSAATGPEQEWLAQLHGGAAHRGPCIVGLKAANRDGMTREIFEMFKCTDRWHQAPRDDQLRFTEFIEQVYLARLRHPKNPKRTFFYGDCMEPKFLQTIGKGELERPIERLLDVRF